MASDKDVKIADRGVKRSLKDCENDKRKLMFLNFIQAGGIIALAVFVIFFQSSVRYFIVDKNKNVEKLREIGKDFSLSVANLYDFAEKAVIMTFSLSYDTYIQQLRNAESYYDKAVFEKLIKEMKRSNFIQLMIKYHRSYYVIPTPTVYNVVQNGKNTYTVFRSFFIKSVGDDGINKQEVVYAVTIRIVNRSKEHYEGMEIVNVHQYSLDDYYSQYGNKGLSGAGNPSQ